MSAPPAPTLRTGFSGPARRLLAQMLTPHRLSIVGVLSLLGLASGLSALSPVFITLALDVGVPRAMDGEPITLILALSGFLGASAVAAVLTFAGIRATARVAQRIVLRLRTRLFEHVQRLSVNYHEVSSSGQLVARQTSDMESIRQFLSNALADAVISLVMMVAIAVMLLWLDPLLALIVFIGFVPLVGFTLWANRRQRDAYRKTRTAIAKVIVHIVETMGGIRAVQVFRRERGGEAKLDAEDGAYRDANVDALRSMAYYTGGTRLIGNASMAAIVLVGGWQVIQGSVEIGVVAAFLLSLRRFYAPLDELAQAFNAYQSAAAALEKVAGVLAVEPDVVEPAEPSEPGPARGRVEFQDVSFRYAPDSAEVLPSFSLDLAAGQTVAMVGATGAGKSTLAKLLARFYDPSEGRVLLDGVDLRDLADAELRSRVLMVTQESYLFSGSIADNIAIGNPEASREEIVEVARAVGLHEFISALPEGYDTDVRRRGGRLSSGQRQLVAFARVFLADPAVVVLDEATASLDIPGERLVQAALERVLAGRTALIIAHRLSTVEIADRVLLLDAGQITEDGTPEELISGGGRFAELHAAWRRTLA